VIGLEHGLEHNALHLLDAADRVVAVGAVLLVLLVLALFGACFQDAIPF
jgi:hypothetical protein